MNTCECGCGQSVGNGKRFILYHNLNVVDRKGRVKGFHLSDGEKQKRSIAMKGHKFSAEHNRKISETRRAKQIAPWNKGAKMSAETIVKRKAWWAENREWMTARLKGHPTALKGRQISREHREKIQKNHARFWLGKHLPEMRARFVSKNKVEQSLEVILQRLYPDEWKFVGDGQVIIAGKCPDFVNVNGQKKIIEVFGDYWHRGEDPKERAAIFAPFGYRTLVIWEHELRNLASVENRVHAFAKAIK
jgi:very-short-patch-repair endonuclease